MGRFQSAAERWAIAVLRDTPRAGPRPFPISDSAIPVVLKRRGLTATVHGFRSSFSTWSAEETDTSEEIREASLAHFTGNRTAAAYQRGDLLAKRRQSHGPLGTVLLSNRGRGRGASAPDLTPGRAGSAPGSDG
jgi:hypothetical protein